MGKGRRRRRRRADAAVMDTARCGRSVGRVPSWGCARAHAQWEGRSARAKGGAENGTGARLFWTGRAVATKGSGGCVAAVRPGRPDPHPCTTVQLPCAPYAGCTAVVHTRWPPHPDQKPQSLITLITSPTSPKNNAILRLFSRLLGRTRRLWWVRGAFLEGRECWERRQAPASRQQAIARVAPRAERDFGDFLLTVGAWGWRRCSTSAHTRGGR